MILYSDDWEAGACGVGTCKSVVRQDIRFPQRKRTCNEDTVVRVHAHTLLLTLSHAQQVWLRRAKSSAKEDLGVAAKGAEGRGGPVGRSQRGQYRARG